MESVLWAFKRLYDKGLVYEGFRVLPYCWECETPLSNFETRQDDSYRDRTDPAVTVRFDLEAVDGRPRLLRGRSGCWPGRRRLGRCPPTWPSPSDPTSRYAVLALGRPARRHRPGVPGGLRRRPRGRRSRHRDRGRARRAPLQPSSPISPIPRAPSSCSAPTSSPSRRAPGIVQMAPGFGEDDQRACEAAGIPVVCPVDERGRFTAEVSDWPGSRSSRPTPRSSRASGRRGPGARTRTTSTATPTAGGRTRPSSTGR